MGFMIYTCRHAGDALRYEQVQSLNLGGTNGAIAQFVKTLPPERRYENWKLTPEEVVEFSGFPGAGYDLAVLLDMVPRDPSAVCLYQLEEIRGGFQGRSTQIALDLTVLLDTVVSKGASEFKSAFTAPPASSRKRLLELLVLSGGPEGGDWRWGSAPMNLGAAVLGTPASWELRGSTPKIAERVCA